MNITKILKGVVNITTLTSFFLWSIAFAEPQGGVVVSGAANISQQNSQTVINQQSQSAVINWSSFNTTASESVLFNQPNASAIALNKINSGQPTNFNGSLNANGQVWIINPSGVLFGSSANINVAGLLATTHGINNSDFMAGNYNFAAPSNLNASIINNGSITAANSGIVALVSPVVINNGIITANLGKIYLSSGASFVLDLYGDQLINFGSNPNISNSYVANSGLIKADGGKVYMTAHAASGILDNVVSMSGVIEANAVSVNQKGEIVLSGGDAGTTVVSGKIKASHGFVETSGHVLMIESTAVIEAGNWLIDPADLTISTAANSNVTGSSPYQPTAAVSVLNVTTLQNALASGNVTVQTNNDGFAGSGNITVANAVTWASGNMLALQAFNNIIVNAALNGGAAGAVNLTAGGSISGAGVITANTLTTSSVTGTTLSGLNAGANFNATNTTSGAISFTHAGALNITGINQAGTNLTITNSTGAITQSGAISVAGTSSFTAGANAITLNNPGNNFTGNVTFSNSGANAVSIFNNAPLKLGAFTVGNSFTASTSGGNITLNGNITSGLNQTYNQPVTVPVNLTLTSTSGNINFGSTVDDSALRTHSLTLIGASAPTFPFATAVGGVNPFATLAITNPSLTVDASLAGVTSDQLNKGTNVTLTASSGNLTLSSPITQTLNPIANTLTLVSAANYNLGSSITLMGTTALSFSAPSFNIDASFAPFIATELSNGTNVTVTPSTAGGINITSPITVSSGTAALTFIANAVNALIDINADVNTSGTQFYQAAGTGGVITLEPGVTIQGGGAITLSNFTFSGSGVNTAINIFGQIGTTAKRQSITFTLGGAPNGIDSSLNLMSGATIVGVNVSATIGGRVITFPAGINWDVTGTLSALSDNVSNTGQVHVTGNLGTALLPINAISLRGGNAVAGSGLINSAVVLAPGVSIYANSLSMSTLRVGATLTIDNVTDLHLSSLLMDAAASAGSQGQVIITPTGQLGSALVPIPNITLWGHKTGNVTAVLVQPGADIYATNLTIQDRIPSGELNISLDNGSINAYHVTGSMVVTTNTFGGGAIAINGVIGAPGDLVGALTVIARASEITLNAPSTGIMTAGGQSYQNPVRLNSNQTLSNNAGNIAFSSTINNCPGSVLGCTSGAGPFSLTTASTSGSTVFSGIVGGLQPISSIDITGAASINTTAITTTGLQIYRGATTLSASPTFTSQTAGITFNSTLNGAVGLTTSVSNGQSVTFNGVVGGTTALASITTSATGATNINGGQVRTSSGAQNWNNPVFINANTTLGGVGTTGAININSTLDSFNSTARSLTLTTTAMTTLAGNIGNTNVLSALTVTNASTINAADIHTTTSQTYSGAVTLGVANINLHTDALGTITFGSTIQGASNLTVNASSTGTVNFNNDIGTVGTPLIGLTVTGLANINTNVGPTIFVSGTETYNNNVLLNNIAAITFGSGIGSTTVFNGTVNRTVTSTAITIAGNLIVGPSGSIGLSSVIASLLVNGTTLGPNVTTSGNQTYMGAVTLNTDETMTSTAGSISFGNTINGDGVSPRSLTLSASAAFQTVTFNGIVGGLVPLNALMVTAGNATNGQINIATSQMSTTGSQTYFARNIQLLNQSSVTLNGSTVTFDGPVPPAVVYKNSATPTDLIINGNVILNATMNTSAPNRFNSIYVSGSTTFQPTISGAQNSVGDQTYVGPVISASAQNVSIASDTGNVMFGSTITTGGFFAANAANGSVGVTYNGDVSVGTLWTIGTANINAANLTTTSGIMWFFNNVMLLQNAVMTSNANDILYSGEINGGFDLTANAAGIVTFSDDVGATTALNNLDVTASEIDIYSGEIQTTGNQTYHSPVVLFNDLTTDGMLTGGNVTFLNTLDGGFSIMINAAGTVEFDGGVGANTALNNLTVTGSAIDINTAYINTSGDQIYNGPITLLMDMNGPGFIAGANIIFNGLLDGAFNVAATASGVVEFDGVVGSITPLNNMDISGSQININTAEINTSGYQNYSNPVVLFSNVDSPGLVAGSFIIFSGTVNGGFNLKINAVGNIFFEDSVGNSNALGLLDVTTAHRLFFSNNALVVNTSAGQNYHATQQIVIDKDGITFTDTGADITFYGNVAINSGVNATMNNTFGNIIFKTLLDGLGSLTATAAQAVEFDGLVGFEKPLAFLDVTGTVINLNTPLIQSIGYQIYRSPVVLLSDVNSPGMLSLADNITFLSTIDGAFNLTINANQTVEFDDLVGLSTALASLDVSGGLININAGEITSTGDQNYHNTVILLSDTRLTSINSTLNFSSTVDSDATPRVLILDAFNPIVLTGNIGNISILSSLEVVHETDINTAIIHTVDAQLYDGIVILGNNTKLTVDNGIDGRIIFGDTISGPYDLFIDPPAIVQFNGDVNINYLNVQATQEIDINTANIQTNNDQFYDGPVILQSSPGSTLTSTSGIITFNNTVDGAFDLTLYPTFGVFFENTVGGVTPLANLTVNGPTVMDSGIINTTLNQQYNGPVNININVVLTSSAGTIVLGSTVDGAFDLIVNAAGGIGVNDAIGGFIPLSSLTFNAPFIVSLGSVASITTQGDQIYNGPFVFAGPPSGVFNILNSNNSAIFNIGLLTTVYNTPVTVNGNAVFRGAFYPVVFPLQELGAIVVTGTTLLDNVSVLSTSQDYQGPVLLNGLISLDSEGLIYFRSTVDSFASGTENLVVNSTVGTPGTVQFDGLVGNTLPFMHLIVTGSQITINASSIINSGDQTYNGPVVLGITSTLDSAGEVTFAGTIDSDVNGPWNLIVNASKVSFKGDIGASQNPMGALTVNADTINFDGNITSVTTSNTQTYNGATAMTIGADPVFTAPNFVINIPVILLADATYTSTSGDIDFQNTINGPANLILNPASGFNAIFENNVGATTPLASLIINGDSLVNGASLIRTNGDQVYSNIMTLNNNLTTLALTSGAIYFGDQNVSTSGVFGSAFDLIAVTNNLANGPTGAGITGIVRVNNFTVGGQGGANLSFNYPAAESFVLGQGGVQAFINTMISPNFSFLGVIYCVNGFCSAPQPVNVPPTQVFDKPPVENCEGDRCDNIAIIIANNNCAYHEIDFDDHDPSMKWRKLLLREDANCTCDYNNKWVHYCKQNKVFVNLSIANYPSTQKVGLGNRTVSWEHFPLTKHDMYTR